MLEYKKLIPKKSYRELFSFEVSGLTGSCLLFLSHWVLKKDRKNGTRVGKNIFFYSGIMNLIEECFDIFPHLVNGICI